jgi:NADH-quinone oxidoreductase subunit M
VIATSGVIFAAAYLLVAVQRLFYGQVDRPENRGLADLSGRELAVLLPLVAGIVWLGVYPKPVLDRMEPSAKAFIEQVQRGLPADQPSVPPGHAVLRAGEEARP